MPHSECVRTGRLGFVSLRFIQMGRRLFARAHTLRPPLDKLIKVIVSRDLRIIEIQLPQACGTSEISEASSGMETISGMAAIIFALIGRNMCSRSVQGIGIVAGTATATIGGMA